MFQQQIACDTHNAGEVSVSGEISRRQQRIDERRALQQCIQCGATAVIDTDYCPEHLAKAVEAAKVGMQKLRDRRRGAKECIDCGAKSRRRRCPKCRRLRRRAGPSKPGVNVVAPGVNVARVDPGLPLPGWTVEPDGRRRRRFRGRARRGFPSREETDAWDLRSLRAELELGAGALTTYYSDEVQKLPRIQREAPLREAIGHFELMQRQLEELVERATKRLR